MKDSGFLEMQKIQGTNLLLAIPLQIRLCCVMINKLLQIFFHADMAELADAPDLGSGGRPCRFKSCYPHSWENAVNPTRTCVKSRVCGIFFIRFYKLKLCHTIGNCNIFCHKICHETG